MCFKTKCWGENLALREESVINKSPLRRTSQFWHKLYNVILREFVGNKKRMQKFGLISSWKEPAERWQRRFEDNIKLDSVPYDDMP